MPQSLPNSPNVLLLSLVHGLLPLCMLCDLPSVVLNISINALTLLSPGHLLSLFATATTTLFSRLKSSTSLFLSLLFLTTLVVSGKL